MPSIISGSGVDLTSNQSVGGVKTLTNQPVISMANPSIKLSDTAGAALAAISVTYDPAQANHTFSGFGSNYLVTAAGPTSIDGARAGFGLTFESNWTNGLSHLQHEGYIQTTGGLRLWKLDLDIVSNFSTHNFFGGVLIDGSQAGSRQDSSSIDTLALTNSLASGYTSLSLKNTHATNKGVKIELGGTITDNVQWEIAEDYQNNGTHRFVIVDRAGGYYSMMIDNSNHTGFGHGIGDTLSYTIDVVGTIGGLHVATGTATSCTGATIGSGSKANAGFVTATTTGVSTIVVTFPFTAPTGWSIAPSNQTTANLIRQSAGTTTTATITGTTVTGDKISYVAFPY